MSENIHKTLDGARKEFETLGSDYIAEITPYIVDYLVLNRNDPRHSDALAYLLIWYPREASNLTVVVRRCELAKRRIYPVWPPFERMTSYEVSAIATDKKHPRCKAAREFLARSMSEEERACFLAVFKKLDTGDKPRKDIGAEKRRMYEEYMQSANSEGCNPEDFIDDIKD